MHADNLLPICAKERQMNQLREKLAVLLADAADKKLKSLNRDSPCVKALKGIDVEAALKEEINRICSSVSFIEITRISFLTFALQVASCEEADSIKKNLRKAVEDAITRIESKSGRLKIPESCRHLFFNL